MLRTATLPTGGWVDVKGLHGERTVHVNESPMDTDPNSKKKYVIVLSST
jgi:hypothetical protein